MHVQPAEPASQSVLVAPFQHTWALGGLEDWSAQSRLWVELNQEKEVMETVGGTLVQDAGIVTPVEVGVEGVVVTTMAVVVGGVAVGREVLLVVVVAALVVVFDVVVVVLGAAEVVADAEMQPRS